MRVTVLSAILMIVAATMMGCGDTIMPCSTDDDCVLDFDFGWDSQAASWDDWGGDIIMVCNEEVSALDKCNQLVAMMQGFMDSDWLPIPDIGELDVCGWMFGDEEAPGTCEMELPF